MIYQCYFKPDQKKKIFKSNMYEGFGLEPEVNPNIALNCPDLKDARTRLFLTEYGAMLHLWRNPEKIQDNWIGFTSYRQLDKFPTFLHSQDSLFVEEMLQEHDVLGWGVYHIINGATGKPATPEFLSESCHPGIMNYMALVMGKFGETIPNAFQVVNKELFANYWIMSLDNFNHYMAWSYPKIKWMLDHCDDYKYTKEHPKAIGYVMERLHIFWYRIFEKKLKNIGVTDAKCYVYRGL